MKIYTLAHCHTDEGNIGIRDRQGSTVKPAMTDIPLQRDRPMMSDHPITNNVLHFYTFVPQIKDYLSYKTTSCGPAGWSYITGFTVFRHRLCKTWD